MNIYLGIILFILTGEYLLELIVEKLNIKSVSPELPSEFEGYFKPEEYKRSQLYLIETARFKLVKDGFFTTVIIIFILTGGFNSIDKFVRSFNLGVIPAGLLFSGILTGALGLLSIPFSFYRTFVIEEKFGFNRMSIKTFFLDILKTWLLFALIGGIIFSLAVWFFSLNLRYAWIYCWVSLAIFQFFLSFIAPALILPLFNKFTPLSESSLKKSIQEYVDAQNFSLGGIFKMDASRRSTKANAYFTGFGKYRRVVLFDTLIEKHSEDELLSILAHEIGHFKLKHILGGFLLSILTEGVMFFLLSLFINNQALFEAFKMENLSVYASIFFFGFLYSPVSYLFSVLHNIFSRRWEYSADKFAILTSPVPEALIPALKKLSVDNLSNLRPHPLKVFLDYNHPPVLKRIEVIRKLLANTGGTLK